MTGAVLNTLNTRLDAEAIALHAGPRRSEGADHRPRVLADDRESAAKLEGKPAGDRRRRPGVSGRASASARRTTRASWPRAIRSSPGAGRTTSGTRSRSTTPRAPPAIPKGVVYHHRGAYLNAVCNIVTWGMPQHPVYLWTLPMFHCNGWCFPWTMAANAGTNVCLRKVEAEADLRADQASTASPTTAARRSCTQMLINAPDELKQRHRRTR